MTDKLSPDRESSDLLPHAFDLAVRSRMKRTSHIDNNLSNESKLCVCAASAAAWAEAMLRLAYPARGMP